MDDITLRSAVYKGTKQFQLQDIPTAKATGFNAAADDYMERGIDLNEQLIKNKPATYFFRMHSDAMIDAGIYPGDILIVDRSLPTTSGKIIIAALDGELVVRRYQLIMNTTSLLAENKRYGAIEISELTNFRTWGVVTYVIHTVN
ncbi:translesion error-prone DNA polymerase V autoproteolytic subunit [Ilyomonas limi]|uniref:Translesion error-prone DNA polymerase V autoproteolytic subunit n=1 Tax=Ilyomonas limi TaxID=2575867 RepID=A0A4V5UUD4_9BACT|nr:translesion error-prone DNA polymerase V autoproteolytic subunit [Ilyomonas limi]TKK68643.1 translesion error-prone DNA polymerase V autoproteolytic subunit [Ilyomonas limi]